MRVMVVGDAHTHLQNSFYVKTKGSDPVYFHQQADLDVMTGLSPNKALHLTLRVVSTAPRMVIRRSVREEKIKGSDPVSFQQQADWDVVTRLPPNKSLQP